MHLSTIIPAPGRLTKTDSVSFLFSISLMIDEIAISLVGNNRSATIVVEPRVPVEYLKER